MKKITASLSERNIDWLRSEAKRLGIGVSEVIRRLIDGFNAKTGEQS